MTKCYTVNGVGFYIQELPQHEALEQAIEYARHVDSKVLDVDGGQVWPVGGVGTRQPLQECGHAVCGCDVAGHTPAEQRFLNKLTLGVCVIAALVVFAGYHLQK